MECEDDYKPFVKVGKSTPMLVPYQPLGSRLMLWYGPALELYISSHMMMAKL